MQQASYPCILWIKIITFPVLWGSKLQRIFKFFDVHQNIYIHRYIYIYTPFSNHFHHVFILFIPFFLVWMFSTKSSLKLNVFFLPIPNITLGAVFKISPRKNTDVAYTKQHQGFHYTYGCRICTRCPTQHQRRRRGIYREASTATRNDQEPNLEASC